MGSFTYTSPISKKKKKKKPWKRSFDFVDVDSRYPKFQPNFKHPKISGFQNFPEGRAFKPRSSWCKNYLAPHSMTFKPGKPARRFTGPKTRRQPIASHSPNVPFRPHGANEPFEPQNYLALRSMAFKPGNSGRNYWTGNYIPPHSLFNDTDERRSALKDMSNNVARRHGDFTGNLKRSSQHPRSHVWRRQPEVSQKYQVEVKPSVGTGRDSLLENKAQTRAMDGLKVPENVLKENAMKNLADYKGDAFQEFSYCWEAFDSLVSEIKSQDSDEAKTYTSSHIDTNIAAVPTKPAASKNLNHKLGKADDSEQKMTSEAKLDDVAENGFLLRHDSVLDTLRTSSQPLSCGGSECLHLKTEMDISSSLTTVLKNLTRENSLKGHAYSWDSVNQKSNAIESKNTVCSHDQVTENTTEIKRMTGLNVLKNTSEDNSSKNQREPSSALNSESCKMTHVKNTFGSKPQPEEDKVGFSSSGEYSTQKPNLEPRDLSHDDDEVVSGDIAKEMDAIDSKSSFVDNATPEQPSRQVTDFEVIPGTGGHKEQEEGFQHLFSDKIVVANMQGEARVSEQTFNNDHHYYFYVADNWVADDLIQKSEQFKDCIILMSDRYSVCDSQKSVNQALKLFKDVYTVRLRAYKDEKSHGDPLQKIDVRTAMALKEERKWVNSERVFVGHVPGVEVGDQFRFRAELAIVSLHHTFVTGIDFVKIQGKNYAISIVESGRYENRSESPNSFIYVGHGGNPSIASNEPVDQKLECGNLALKNSCEKGVPIRVIRGRHMFHEDSNSNTLGSNGNKRYTYEGLFVVTRYWQERLQHGKMAFMFELHRMPNQPNLTQQMPLRTKKLGRWRPRQVIKKWRKIWTANRTRGVFKNSPKRSTTTHGHALECVALDDVSQGKEKFPIRVVSDICTDRLPPFTYTTNMIYPDWYHPSLPLGCNCKNGCSDSMDCFCAFKNGGEIPFNNQGILIKPNPVIYECGPICKCPPSCRNRVSQLGLRYHLEIFKKNPSGGWGVRSRNYISSGSFICEFIGEFLDKKESGKSIGYNEYLFNGNGFIIDAARWGNVARFINGGFSPNICVQNVLYDDDFESVPHIMLFASKNIPPLQELTFQL